MKQPVRIELMQKASRMSFYGISPDVTTVEYGQHFHLNDDGLWEYADGTRKSYPSILVRENIGPTRGIQGEITEGRDEITTTGKLTVLVTNFEIPTLAYDDTQTFTPGEPLVAGTNGYLTPYVPGTHDAAFIVGYVTVPPIDGGELTYSA